MTEIKNTLEGINSRISEAEEQISELEDKMVEITSEDQNKVKRLKRTEDSLRDLWDNIKNGMRKFLKRLQLKTSPAQKRKQSEVQEVQSPIQDKPQEKHAKPYTNKNNKD